MLLGVPFLGWAMMSNNVIRAEGFPRIAMLTIMIPALVNIILDPIFIIWLIFRQRYTWLGFQWADILRRLLRWLTRKKWPR